MPARVQIPVPPSATSRLLYKLLGRVRLGFLVISPFRIACEFLHWDQQSEYGVVTDWFIYIFGFQKCYSFLFWYSTPTEPCSIERYQCKNATTVQRMRCNFGIVPLNTSCQLPQGHTGGLPTWYGETPMCEGYASLSESRVRLQCCEVCWHLYPKMQQPCTRLCS
jgi:hypothetical protein